MDNNQKNQDGERKFSHNKATQELIKGLTNLEDIPNIIPQQGKDINFLSNYYNRRIGNADFIEKIGRLNKKFYNGSEKYVKSKKMVEKLNDDLYLNLFQQIDCYVEEIERLNKKIALNNSPDLKKKIDQLNKEISEKNEKIRNCEKKLKEKTNIEEKLKKEIESYKRSITFYKDKINIGILARNRNRITSYGRDTSSKIGYKKKTHKNQTNYLSPTKYRIINNKENEEEKEKERNNTIKINKGYKTKESYFYFANRTEYDVYGKDIEEKENESDNEYNYIRSNMKAKTFKINNESEDILPEETGLKFSTKFLNALNEELYGSPKNNDSNNNLDLFHQKSSSKMASEKKDSNEIDNAKKRYTVKNDSKTNTIKSDIKGRNTNKFTRLTKSSKKNKSQIFHKNTNEYKSSKTNKKKDISLKDENENENTNKKKQLKTLTKSRTKPDNKSSDKTTNLSDVHTPYVKKKFTKTFEKEKEKNMPSTKTQSSTESTPSIKYKTNTVPSKSDNKIIKIDVKQNIKRGSNGNNKLNINKKIKNENNSMSNLNAISRYATTSRFNVSKKYEKENSKELTSLLKDVNDDYIKSIEMLRKQEEQIKYMLRFIDLDDDK